jgi:hypothetical protein
MPDSWEVIGRMINQPANKRDIQFVKQALLLIVNQIGQQAIE